MKNRTLIIINSVIAAVIIAFLIWYIYFFQKSTDIPVWIAQLPYCNAFFNFLSFICLIKAVKEIKQKNVEAHKKFIGLSLIFSALFLLSYLTHHFYIGDTKFLTQGFLRPIYFFILISHIILSIVVLPLILITVSFGYFEKLPSHRKIAKITYPIWAYVSLTGILIVLFIKFLNVGA